MSIYKREVSVEELAKYVGGGWKGIVTDLVADLFDLGWDGNLAQIKEKFGGLRIYIGKGSPEIYNRIQKAERESLSTCERDGSPGRPVHTASGWIKTLCGECIAYEERKQKD